MWDLTDWSDKSQKSEEVSSANVIEKLFKNIFQSETVASNPVIAEAKTDIENYTNFCEVTDRVLTKEELQTGTLKMKRG